MPTRACNSILWPLAHITANSSCREYLSSSSVFIKRPLYWLTLAQMNSEPLRPLRFLSQTIIISGDNVEAAESAYSCASNLIASSIFRAGAFLLKGRLVRAFATVAIGWGLLPGNLWSQTVPAESPSQTPTPPTTGTESTCFGATVSKIDFPGISLPDQQTLRGMIAAHEGAPLDRARLQ